MDHQACISHSDPATFGGAALQAAVGVAADDDPGEARKYLAVKYGDVGSQEDCFWRHRQLVAIMNKPLKEEWAPTALMTVAEVSMVDEFYRAAVGKEFTPRVMSCLDRCHVRR